MQIGLSSAMFRHYAFLLPMQIQPPTTHTALIIYRHMGYYNIIIPSTRMFIVLIFIFLIFSILLAFILCIVL